MPDRKFDSFLGPIVLIHFRRFDGTIVQELLPAYLAGWMLLDDERLGTEFEGATLFETESGHSPGLNEWIRSP